MKLIKQLIFALFVGSFALAGSGCSAIGFVIGEASDSNKTKRFGLPSGEIATKPIPSNSQIQLSLKNGQQQFGEFLFMMEKKVGDSVVESIVWRDNATDRQTVTPISEIDRVTTINDQGDKWLGIEKIAALPSSSLILIFLKNGQQQEGEFLMYLQEEVGDETVKSIVWYDKANNQQVSTKIGDIERIIAKPKQNGEMTGLAIGGVIDAILTFVVLKLLVDDLFDFGF